MTSLTWFKATSPDSFSPPFSFAVDSGALFTSWEADSSPPGLGSSGSSGVGVAAAMPTAINLSLLSASIVTLAVAVTLPVSVVVIALFVSLWSTEAGASVSVLPSEEIDPMR